MKYFCVKIIRLPIDIFQGSVGTFKLLFIDVLFLISHGMMKGTPRPTTRYGGEDAKECNSIGRKFAVILTQSPYRNQLSLRKAAETFFVPVCFDSE